MWLQGSVVRLQHEGEAEVSDCCSVRTGNKGQRRPYTIFIFQLRYLKT